jgi:hypothetical protein
MDFNMTTVLAIIGPATPYVARLITSGKTQANNRPNPERRWFRQENRRSAIRVTIGIKIATIAAQLHWNQEDPKTLGNSFFP